MRVAVRINDTPTGKLEVIVVLDSVGDAWVRVTTRREAEIAAELWGLTASDVDWSEVGDLLR
jgi:hypothetical protein